MPLTFELFKCISRATLSLLELSILLKFLNFFVLSTNKSLNPILINKHIKAVTKAIGNSFPKLYLPSFKYIYVKSLSKNNIKLNKNSNDITNKNIIIFNYLLLMLFF